MNSLNPRGISGRLTILTFVATALTVAGLVAAFNFGLYYAVVRDVDSGLRSQAAAVRTTITPTGGHSFVIAHKASVRALEGQMWIFRGVHQVARAGDVTITLESAARSLIGSPAKVVQSKAAETRLYATPITHNGRHLGTIVVGRSLLDYRSMLEMALVISSGIGLLMLAIVTFLAHLFVVRGLRPVARIAESVAGWNPDDRGYRVGAEGRPGEIAELAVAVDGLLARVEAKYGHSPSLSSELPKELRLPVERMMLEAEMLLRRPRSVDEYIEFAQGVHHSGKKMLRTAETLNADGAGDTRSMVAGEGFAPDGGLIDEELAKMVTAPEKSLPPARNQK